MYRIDISPAANSVLEDYALRCLADNGEACALRLLDPFDDMVFQIKDFENCIKIEYLIDDRQNYGTFLK